jgi:hypothetical protein
MGDADGHLTDLAAVEDGRARERRETRQGSGVLGVHINGYQYCLLCAVSTVSDNGQQSVKLKH